nr:YraN family protein [Synechococcus sp. MU1651]
MQQLEAQGWRLLDRSWHCRWGELDLVLERQQQLLVVEVKGRRTGHRDRHGLDAFHSAKRRRMARAISCWRAVHPASAEHLLRVKLALVPLMTSRRTIRWIDVERLC